MPLALNSQQQGNILSGYNKKTLTYLKVLVEEGEGHVDLVALAAARDGVLPVDDTVDVPV